MIGNSPRASSEGWIRMPWIDPEIWTPARPWMLVTLAELTDLPNGLVFEFAVATGGRLLDDVAGTGFRVFTKASFAEGGQYEESEGVARAWFEKNGCTSALVRPDHYVYGVARNATELEAQKTAMEQALQCS